jgi:hypothetical protein
MGKKDKATKATLVKAQVLSVHWTAAFKVPQAAQGDVEALVSSCIFS